MAMDAIAGIEIGSPDGAALASAMRDANAGAGGGTAGRAQMLSLVKAYRSRVLEHGEAELMVHGQGRLCAAFLSDAHDALISAAFEVACEAQAGGKGGGTSPLEALAIVATGGFGRGLLAPGSDIDLLFLMPAQAPAGSETVIEALLYLLWDAGLKVGHATRTVEQCVALSRSDSTIRTALIDARLIRGDKVLYLQFEQRFSGDITKASARDFIEAKMAERDERHRRSGSSRYLVEPNVKDGKGGLRDLHTLHWLSRYLVDGGDGDGDTNRISALAPDEQVTFRRSEDFLWSVRCHLHFLAGRAEERLTFDLQPEMARRLRYRASSGQQPVERFMKHYFLVAKDVGDLTTVVSSALEIAQLKAAPRLNEMLNPLSWSARRNVRRLTDFRIENGRVIASDADVFKRNPRNLLRLFDVANETGSYLHPETVRQVRRSLRLIDDDLRADGEAAKIFFKLLTDSGKPERILRQIHAADVLGRYIPEFGQVTAMMQFNMYHHFTVDEHLLRTVGELSDIEAGRHRDDLPLSSEIFPTIKNRRALYLAALVHDIGKGRKEDHSVLGARLAERISRRLGLSDSERALVVWLVRHHLVMSNTSQSRDLADPKTISDLAEIVQTKERLKLLLLLTVADIRAVGPGTWNGWKGQLLRQLYGQTDGVLSDESPDMTIREQAEIAQESFRAELADVPADEVERFIERQYTDYWLRTELKSQVAHARLLREIEADGRKLAVAFSTDKFTAMTELNIVAPNHPRLLSLFAGCCSAAGADILGAQIATTRDGLVLDTFVLARAFDDDADETRRTKAIWQTIERVLKGEVRLASLLANRRPAERRIEAFSVPAEVLIDNELSDQFTVIEVVGRDRPGLLHELTGVLSDLSLDINSAHITTFGERAVDAFYVTDLTGKKIVDTDRQQSIAERLAPVLQPPEDGNRA